MSNERKKDPFGGSGSPFASNPKLPTVAQPTPAPVEELPTAPVASGSFPTPAFPKPEFKPARGAANELFPSLPEAPTKQDPFATLEVEVQPVEVEEEEDELAGLSDYEIDLAQKLEDSSNEPAALPTLYSLAEDSDWVVRANIAANESTPATLLERLAKDSESLVRETVMANPNAPENVYRYFAFDADDDLVYDWVSHPRTTPEMLKPLYETNNAFIASAVIDSPLAPESVKMALKQKHQL